MEEKNILKDLHEQLSEERDEVQKLLNVNLSKISEIEEFLKSIYEKEDSDFKIFSPRSAENLYKENIDKSVSEKQTLEIENRTYYKRLNQLDRYLEGLKKLDTESVVDKDTSSLTVSCCENIDTGNSLKVLDIQEKERQRIARDLHDSSLQNLAHLVHKIELSSMFIDQDPLRAKLELATVSKNLRSVIDDIRNTIFDMRPMTFDDLGLKDCFERLFINLKQANPAFDFSSDIDELTSENDLVLMTIYRVVQECCSNAIKHSGGNHIFVSLKKDDVDCIITIKDNGKGFDIQETFNRNEKHFGLSIMSERVQLIGGSIKVNSDSNGTEIYIIIPLNRIEG